MKKIQLKSKFLCTENGENTDKANCLWKIQSPIFYVQRMEKIIFSAQKIGNVQPSKIFSAQKMGKVQLNQIFSTQKMGIKQPSKIFSQQKMEKVQPNQIFSAQKMEKMQPNKIFSAQKMEKIQPNQLFSQQKMEKNYSITVKSLIYSLHADNEKIHRIFYVQKVGGGGGGGSQTAFLTQQH